ncbi:MAG TPA: hypothetical protein VKU00_31865, partial [Chthonomonadaceae bacterium]|nr:hypothetical protein [Chthonomonadaceae bacterium]
LVRCEANTQHFYGGHLSECPWCERKRVQLRGLDPFPSEQEVAESRKARQSRPVLADPETTIYPPAPVAGFPTPTFIRTAGPANNPVSSATTSGLTAFAFAAMALFIGIFLVGALNRTPQETIYADGQTVENTYGTNPGSSRPTTPVPISSLFPPIPPRPNGFPSADNAVAFSPDGKTVYGGYQTVYACDVRTGKIERTFQQDPEAISSFSLSHDGKLLATGGSHSLVLWDTSTGRKIQAYPFEGDIEAFALSPDGSTLAIGSTRERIHRITLWEARTGEQKASKLQWSGSNFYSLRFSPDGQFLAACGKDSPSGGRLGYWHVASNQVILTHIYSEDVFLALAIAPDGGSLALADTTIHRFSPDPNQPDYWRELTPRRHNALAFAPDGQTIALSHYDGIELRDASTGSFLREFEIPASSYFDAIAFSPDGKTLLAGEATRGLELFDVQTGKRIKTLTNTKPKWTPPHDKEGIIWDNDPPSK